MVQADPELEAIRQRRMQELMAQHGEAPGNRHNSEQQNAQEDDVKRFVSYQLSFMHPVQGGQGAEADDGR